MNEKIDYQKQQDIILASIKNYENSMSKTNGSKNENNLTSLLKPSLLLHACCAPCSSYVIEALSNFFNIIIYYYNPNIHPEAEYIRRLTELQNFLQKFTPALTNKVTLIAAPYNPEDFFIATNTRKEIELQTENERGERCRRCYFLRMKKAYEFAKANSFDFFTTTLSISPYKDSKMINEIGYELEKDYSLLPVTSTKTLVTATGNIVEKNNISALALKKISSKEIQSISFRPSTGLHYLPADFKKHNGFLRSLEISKEYGLYRQDYCGCIYSKQNMHHSS